jgi:hypothetical protein
MNNVCLEFSSASTDFIIIILFSISSCWVGPLSPRHGASSGGGWREILRLRRVAANISNKQSLTVDKGGPPACGLGVWLTTSHRKTFLLLRNVSKRLGPGLILWHDLSKGRPLGRPRRRWDDNIKLDLREIGIDGANWIRLAQDRVQWRAFVNTVMKLRLP